MIDLALDGVKVSMELGRPRVAVGSAALKTVVGRKGKQHQIAAFDSNDIAFYQMEEKLVGDTIIKDITTSYRAGEFETSLQKALTLYSQNIGLGEKAFKWENGAIKTATEVISENSVMYQTMRKHQEIVKECIIDVCKAILDMNNKDFDIEIKIEFDDSVIVDKESERARWQQLYRDNVIPKWLYLVEYEGYSEKEAKALVSEASQVISIDDFFNAGGDE